MTIAGTRGFLIGMIVALLGALPVDAVAAADAVACEPTAAKAIVAGSNLKGNYPSTKSDDPVNVPRGRIYFDHGGTDSSCVIVSFSSEVKVYNKFSYMGVRVMIDGTSPCDPETVVFADNINASHTRSTQFICAFVEPGSHWIQVQYWVGGSFGKVELRKRTLTVHYTK